jgi:hypothetical protein
MATTTDYADQAAGFLFSFREGTHRLVNNLKENENIIVLKSPVVINETILIPSGSRLRITPPTAN